MKAKTITARIKELKSVLDDVVRTGDAIERGGMVAEEKGTYFTSFEAFRKALTRSGSSCFTSSKRRNRLP